MIGNPALIRVRRVVAMLLAILSGIIFLYGIILSAILFFDQIPEEKRIAQSFREAESFVRAQYKQTGQFPSDAALEKWGDAKLPAGVSRLHLECLNPDFKQPEKDLFVIAVWRTDWDECYSSPSGKTTLPTPWDWIRNVLTIFLASVVPGFLAWIIFPKRKSENSAVYAASSS